MGGALARNLVHHMPKESQLNAVRGDGIAVGRQESSSHGAASYEDKAHLTALAAKPFGSVGYQQRALMPQTWDEDKEALEPKALVSADLDCEPGILTAAWC